MPITLSQVHEARHNLTGIALRTPLVPFACDSAPTVYLKLD